MLIDDFVHGRRDSVCSLPAFYASVVRSFINLLPLWQVLHVLMFVLSPDRLPNRSLCIAVAMLHLRSGGAVHLLPHSLEDRLDFFSGFSQSGDVCDARLERAGVHLGSQQQGSIETMTTTATRRLLYQAMNASLAGGLQLGQLLHKKELSTTSELILF